jgi:hypothetical protein
MKNEKHIKNINKDKKQPKKALNDEKYISKTTLSQRIVRKYNVCLCRICKKPTGKKPNGFYCKECAKHWNRYKTNRIKIGNNTWAWIRRNQIVRAVQDGKDVNVIYEGQEMVE